VIKQQQNTKQGLIFNIQRYSLHDGPGIRTVVFFKGCPLRCKWCANPESLKFAQEISYNSKDCIGCQKCVGVCPSNAILFDGSKIDVDQTKCELSLACTHACPTGALLLDAKYYSVAQVMQIVLKDEAFYKNSGGGITLSGGECLSQSQFVIDLLKAAKDKNLHTAIETSGYCQWDEFENVLEYVDLVLYDLKHVDDDIHKEYIGVSNAVILSNLKKIADSEKDMIVRIPIIPTVNDDEASISQYIDLLKNHKTNAVHLLPFHQLGESKYALAGVDYAFSDVKPPSDGRMAKILKKILDENINAKIGG
jgi:pyruvate formate lyase activating enzyme